MDKFHDSAYKPQCLQKRSGHGVVCLVVAGVMGCLPCAWFIQRSHLHPDRGSHFEAQAKCIRPESELTHLPTTRPISHPACFSLIGHFPYSVENESESCYVNFSNFGFQTSPELVNSGVFPNSKLLTLKSLFN